MLTAYDDDRASYAAVLAGAERGTCSKTSAARTLIEGIRGSPPASTLVPQAVGGKVVDSLTPTGIVPQPRRARAHPARAAGAGTDRRGAHNRQIGERLELAEKTVKNYVSGLLAKLGMERRTQAAVYGAEHRRPGKNQPRRRSVNP